MRKWLLLVVGLIFSSSSAGWAQGVPVERLEASVNSALVLLSDIQKFRQTLPLRTQLDPLFAGTALAAKGANATAEEIVEFLIDEKLIAQQFPVTDPEVEQQINSIQANNRIDRARLKAALADQGFSFDDYFELIRISASKGNLIDRDIRTKVTISDDDVKNYFYNNYKQSTAAPKAYKLQIIAVSIENYKTPSAAKDVVTRALGEIRAGEPFEEVAKRMSDHPTASSGGELGIVTDDQMSPLIREQVKRLKIGETSAVFGGPSVGSYYIVRLQDVKSGESGRLEKVKEEIRTHLLAAEYQHQISLWLERQRQNAFIHRAGESSIAGLPLTK